MVANPLPCQEFVELVTAYEERRLRTDRRRKYEEHVLVCPACRMYRDQMQQTTRMLARLGPPDRRRPESQPLSEVDDSRPDATIRAFKFLEGGRIGPFSGERWPEPGGIDDRAWVRARDEADLCANGIHACRIADLPYWVNDELWVVELGGILLEDENKLVARCGRLVARVSAWNDTAKQRFGNACLHVARESTMTVLREGDLDHATALAEPEAPDDIATLLAALGHGDLTPPQQAARSYLEFAVAFRDAPASIGFLAAVAAEHADGPRAGELERQRQGRWLDEELHLSELLSAD
jgi:hypothetical protein